MELLNPDHAPDNTEDVIAGETFSRSSIIQQLSIFVAFLNSSSSCHSRDAFKVSKVIKKVLDHALNHTRQPQTTGDLNNLGLNAD